MNTFVRFSLFAFSSLLVLALAPAHFASAATIDVPDCDTNALVAAINTANSTPEPDTIVLAGESACVFDASTVDNSTVEFGPNAFPVITTKITIQAIGWKRIEGSKGDEGIRFFLIAPTGKLVLKGMQLRSGRMAKTANPNLSYPGGAIYNNHGLLKINGASLLANTGNGDGGAVYNDGGNVRIKGALFQANSAQHGGGVFNTADGDLKMRASVFFRYGGRYGAGIVNYGHLKFESVTFRTSNGSGILPEPPFTTDGGAIINYGTMQISTGSFLHNRAVRGIGGAIANYAELTVVNSTFWRNLGGFGGAIWNKGTLTVANSTFNQNEAMTDGGAIFNRGIMNIFNVTLADNTAEGKGGNIMSKTTGTTTVANTIITGGSPQNCSGNLVVEGGNLRFPDSDPTCQGEYGDPMLEVWGKYGSPTEVMPLKPGSRAINKGLAENCQRVPVSNLDQRGVTRVIGNESRCDSGAYEVE